MGWEGPGMGLGENFFWGSDQTTGTTGTTGSGWLSLFWLFRTACYLNPAPRAIRSKLDRVNGPCFLISGSAHAASEKQPCPALAKQLAR